MTLCTERSYILDIIHFEMFKSLNSHYSESSFIHYSYMEAVCVANFKLMVIRYAE